MVNNNSYQSEIFSDLFDESEHFPVFLTNRNYDPSIHMIHRFLIFDRKFNCRLDRRYPLNQFATFNEILNKPIPVLKVTESGGGGGGGVPVVMDSNKNKPATGCTWNTLIIKEDNNEEEESEGFISNSGSDSLIPQFNRLELAESSLPRGEIVEYSQQLILGLTHSLKNMLTKLSPSVIIVNNPPSYHQNGPEGHLFSFKTSKYRLYYFESFTGWKLVMLTDCNQTPNPNLSTSTNPETVLKTFYTQILLKYLLTYPLGTIYTTEKSSESNKILVKDDFLHRSGFLSKMDEFVQNIDRIF